MSGGIGRMVLSVAGMALGSALGPIGAAVGGMLGGLAGAMIFPENTTTRTVSEGSRLTDLQVQSSTYGKKIPRVRGRVRLAGNIVWSVPIIEEKTVKETTTKVGGGKGGSSKVKNTEITYSYYGTFAVSICAGPIQGVYKIWADSKLIYNSDTADAGTIARSEEVPVLILQGREDQSPCSVIEGYLGYGNVPAYRGQALAVFEKLPLKNYGNRLPNLSFEVQA